MKSERINFSNGTHDLSAAIDWPTNRKPLAFAVFAHCFTCSKDLHASKSISQGLTSQGLAVLRFDFTGLGRSEGNFEDSNFSSNLNDLIAACEYLAENHQAPQILVGHSLGGAAVLRAGAELESVKAIATIGSPADPEHVTHLFADKKVDIVKEGKANVNIGGRPFSIKADFIEDLKNRGLPKTSKKLRGKAILVLHSPQDTIVGIANAKLIYDAVLHPKSFVTLDGADHLLTNKADGRYAGGIIGQWVSRYIPTEDKELTKTQHQVVAELGSEGYTTEIQSGSHHILADEPADVGGDDLGPSPYDLVSSGLAACTVMTLQMYARRKNWPLEHVAAHISHAKDYASDCDTCETDGSKIDKFERVVELKGDLSQEQVNKLTQIANRCPVHKTLHSPVEVPTKIIHKT